MAQLGVLLLVLPREKPTGPHGRGARRRRCRRRCESGYWCGCYVGGPRGWRRRWRQRWRGSGCCRRCGRRPSRRARVRAEAEPNPILAPEVFSRRGLSQIARVAVVRSSSRLRARTAGSFRLVSIYGTSGNREMPRIFVPSANPPPRRSTPRRKVRCQLVLTRKVTP